MPCILCYTERPMYDIFIAIPFKSEMFYEFLH